MKDKWSPEDLEESKKHKAEEAKALDLMKEHEPEQYELKVEKARRLEEHYKKWGEDKDMDKITIVFPDDGQPNAWICLEIENGEVFETLPNGDVRFYGETRIWDAPVGRLVEPSTKGVTFFVNATSQHDQVEVYTVFRGKATMTWTETISIQEWGRALAPNKIIRINSNNPPPDPPRPSPPRNNKACKTKRTRWRRQWVCPR